MKKIIISLFCLSLLWCASVQATIIVPCKDAYIDTLDSWCITGDNFIFTVPSNNSKDLLHVITSNINFSSWSWYVNYYNENTNSAPVPEPATMLLLGTGLVFLTKFRRKGV